MPFKAIFDLLEQGLKVVEEEINKHSQQSFVRELHLTKTKLEEALLWCGRADTLAQQQGVELQKPVPTEEE